MSESIFEGKIVRPEPDSGLGFASCARELMEAAISTFTPPHYPDDLPRGQGETVLLIPGFLAGDWTMLRLRDFLVHLDYRVEFAGVAVNLGPTRRLIPQLEQAVQRLHAESNRPLVVIGQSLGGVFARGLAHRHPDKICHVVTLCSPIRFPVATPLEALAKLLAPLHDPDTLDLENEILRAPPVPVTALYSKSDGILDWRSCLQDETADCINLELAGAHSSMGSNPEAQAAIARALAAVSAKAASPLGPAEPSRPGGAAPDR
jgi:hypothetical protein